MDGCEQLFNNQPVRLADTLARGGGSSNIQSNLIRCDEREAVSDTLGKSDSAHRARGPTPHEGWAPHMGQFLQGGNFGCFVSFFFFKVEPLCDQT